MSGAKHTPGPWMARVEETATVRDSQDNQLSIVIYVHTKTGGRRNGDEVAANARLIAAAPDLLQFAEEFVEAWADGMAGDSSFLKAAQAAVAKARGEV